MLVILAMKAKDANLVFHIARFIESTLRIEVK
jgi:hypothetical protein